MYENERKRQSTLGFILETYDHINLTTIDVSDWCTSDMQEIPSIKNVKLPNDFVVIVNWDFVDTSMCVKSNQRTDSKGWRYARSFQNPNWVSCSLLDSCVRRRIHQRLIVPMPQLIYAQSILSHFYSQLSSVRSYNEYFIRSTFLGVIPADHLNFQMVLECERRPSVDSAFSSADLLPTDPPHWSVAVVRDDLESEASIAPWLDPSAACVYRKDLEDLTNVLLSTAHRIDTSLTILHDFMFCLHTLQDHGNSRDSSGWQYGRCFFGDDGTSSLMWKPSPHDLEPGALVRRRLWIRTLVPHDCKREALQRLKDRILLSPRGTCIKEGSILRMRSFGLGWTKGWATLSDYKLSIKTDRNSLSAIDFELMGFEVSKVPELTSSEGFRSGFGLRKRDFGNTDNNMVIVLSAETEEERRGWVAALSHQLALLHGDCYKAYFAPPLVDEVLLSSDMWKRRQTVPAWSLRTLELRTSGTLLNYDGPKLRGIFDIVGCSFMLQSPNEYTFMVSKN